MNLGNTVNKNANLPADAFAQSNHRVFKISSRKYTNRNTGIISSLKLT